MREGASRFNWLAVALAAYALGCGKGPVEDPPAAEAPRGPEEAVRQAFTGLQAAIRAREDDRLWSLLAARSRAEAWKEARGVRAAYEKAGPAERAAQGKDLGLPGAALEKLTGVGFLHTKPFRDKFDEVADGIVTGIKVEADSATVAFDEPDGDREKIVFVREDGAWKAWLTIPKVKRP